MPKHPERGRLAVGLISGTSMDGMDAALVRISGPAAHPRVRLLAFETHPRAIRCHAAQGDGAGVHGGVLGLQDARDL